MFCGIACSFVILGPIKYLLDNAAFLLDLRASLSDVDAPEAITDRVMARRLRSKVKEICDQLLAGPVPGETERDRAQNKYWIKASKFEAMFGLGQKQEALALLETLKSYDGIENWMIETTTDQLEKLENLL